MEVFGKILKELRQEHKLSQTKLGELVGVSQDMISLYELGTSEPSQTTLIKIAKHFDITLDCLLGITEY